MITEINQQQEKQQAQIWAVEEIHRLPLMLDTPLYHHYPAMKLGGAAQIAFFSRQLGALAIEILQKDFFENGKSREWVLTAPPYYQLPAAANLLARDIQRLLRQQGYQLDLVEPRLNLAQIEIRNQEDLKNYYDYSKNNLQQRIVERQRLQQTLDTDALKPLFEQKSVIVINDIKVTGTQQHFMQQRLNQLAVDQCHWLYIFNLEQTLAERHPEIEHRINNSQIQDMEAYASILTDINTRHTARCIGRFFNENRDTFLSLVALLDSGTRAKIYHLAQQEGRYNHDIFSEKMDLLKKTILRAL